MKPHFNHRFRDYVYSIIGEVRQIDLAAMLGEKRGELVRKWFNGSAYPDERNIEKLAILLKVTKKELQRVIYDIKIDEIMEE